MAVMLRSRTGAALRRGVGPVRSTPRSGHAAARRTRGDPGTSTASLTLLVLCAAHNSHQRGGRRTDRTDRAGRGGGRLYGKSLQNGIKHANTVEEVLNMVAESEDFLDHIHCVTAIYKIAKLTQGERRNKGRVDRQAVKIDLLGDERFEVLKRAIESQINKFDSWATANLLYSFALLRCNPGYSLLDLLTGHAVSLGTLLSTVDVSNAYWAFSQLKYKPHPDVLTNLWEVAVQNIAMADIRSVSGLLESAVKTGHKPSKASLTAISDFILESWSDISARETANVFISFVRLGFAPPREILMLVDAKILRDFGQFSNRDVALCLSAFRLAKHKPSDQVLALVLRKINTNFDDYNERDVIQIMYSLAKMNVDPGAGNLNKVADQMLRNPKSCTAESTLRMLDAYLSTGYEPTEDFVALVKERNKKTNARSGSIIRRF